MMHRFPSGVAGEKVHQKRVPAGAPPWLETVRVAFPRYGRHADELCVTELASVVWAVQMSTVEFHPWNSRRADTERPDEWRIDLDPMPRVRVRHRPPGRPHLRTRSSASSERPGGRRPRAATACTSTSGSSRGWGFAERAAGGATPSPARSSAARRTLVTTTWWRKDRDPGKLFVDYNQNARDHTIASAYSVRGVPEATVPPRSPGTRSTTSTRASSPSPPSRPASPSSATCTRASTTAPTRWTPCWPGPTATGSTSRRLAPGCVPAPPGRTATRSAANWPSPPAPPS